MKFFFSAFTIGLTVVGTFIYWADPAQRWHRQVFPQHAMARGEVWPWPADNIDQVGAKLAMSRYTDPVDLVIMGSSRILYVNMTMLSDTVKRLNLAVGYASILKHRAFWDVLKRRKVIPRYVLLEVDPWLFDQRWNRQQGRTLGTTSEASLSSLIDFKELFSSAMLRASWIYLRRGRQTPRGYRWDGSVYTEQPEQVTHQMLEDYVASEISTGFLHRTLVRWTVDWPVVDSTKEFLKDLSQENVKTLILSPPLHPLLYKQVFQNPNYAEKMREHFALLSQLAAETPGAQVCNAVNPATFGCTDLEFTDSIHMDDSCSRKVIEGCFSRIPAWRMLLAQQPKS